MPNNCLKCEHACTCGTYYGSSTCEHKNEIAKRAIEMLFENADNKIMYKNLNK